MTKLLFSELTYYLRGICFDIHNALSAGHAEVDYENALAIALEQDDVPFRRQPIYRIDYRGKQVGKYRPDLILEDGKVLLELKAQPSIGPLHKAQTLSYLRVTGADLGMIMNFGAASMQFARLPNFAAGRSPVAKKATRSWPNDLLFPDLIGELLKALHRVHFELGSGYLHQVYRRATRIQLAHQGIAVRYLQELPLRFRNSIIGKTTTRLLVVDQNVLLATVALQTIQDRDRERLRWALNETGCQLGLIANFYPSRLALDFIRRT